jgi:uncharacterized protein YndB with AHSA1/START domain
VADEPDIRIVRAFDAPIERVWAEWTEPARFADWFGGAQGEVPLSSVSMDVRPGGAWRLTMFAGPRRQEIRWAGEYVEVEPPTRLSFTITDSPEEPLFDLVSVALSARGDNRTEMVLEQRGGHMTPEQYRRAEQGWGGFLDRIDERLRAGPGG